MNERICSLVILGWEIAVARAMRPELMDRPVLLESKGRIWAASFEAIEEGSRPGMRIRDAHRCSPTAAILERDANTALEEFRAFATALYEAVNELEVVAPGEVAFRAGSATRTYGGEQGLIDHILAIAPVVPALSLPGGGGARAGVGVADGRFAAAMAARIAGARSLPVPAVASSGPPAGSAIVPVGAAREFLTSVPIEVLSQEIDAPDLIETFLLLGIKTLGDLAAMPSESLMSRFGKTGLLAHQLACGSDHRPLLLSRVDTSLEAECELDPPVTNIDQLTFAVKSLGDRLAATMEQSITTARALRLEAIDEQGATHTASWRNDGGISSAAERARWHVESWRLQSGISQIRLLPEGVEAERGEQLTLSCMEGVIDPEAELRAERAVSRLSALTDTTGVFRVIASGGRLPHERASLKAIGSEGLRGEATSFRSSVRSSSTGLSASTPPWPGRLPSPAPARIESKALATKDLPEELRGPMEIPTINGRPVASAVGPFRYRMRWWSPDGGIERDVWQIALDDGTALLVSRDRAGNWVVEAIYD